ncbi:MAG: hypothetical protein B6D72_15445 [gamma proteobacterium symbiont of Ctena orbiculata]|nr:MAG: hypothetical protein B6D72_15445 [gamma proteobacterium symbiont of Ctena orbiculata]PVV16606.1 MAG: hypothetical protein B6D82_00625 [gamma proteobacterium symbiont of Ctena orbiculata]PVV19122.1 MAG: hypothetical protein B6D74_15265 [gamma proteobacterium symbiont of Ctena orbiculata]
MQIAEELIEAVERIAQGIELPLIDEIILPKPNAPQVHDAEFAAVSLGDGSMGFFYTLLDDTMQRLHDEIDADAWRGRPPIQLAHYYGEQDPLARSMGLGAISAITQSLFRRADYMPDRQTNSMAKMAFSQTDHVGMVGYFPPLVERLRGRGVRLSVIEKRAEFVQQGDRFQVTLDPRVLAECNKILCTAATLLNDSLDEILAHCGQAQRVAVIGPTAGCLPDPLFSRGVDAIGGSRVAVPERLKQRLRDQLEWADAVEKYTIERDDYPGFEQLLLRASR